MRPSVHTHAAAATDGALLLIVAANGKPSTRASAPALLAAARRGLHPQAARPTRPVEPEVREALRELGYAE